MLKRLAKHHLKMDHKHDIVDEVVGVTENHVPILGEAIEVHAEDHLDKTGIPGSDELVLDQMETVLC